MVMVNVTVSPSTIPSGRLRPPVAPALSSAGSTGSTQGLRAVPAPARKAKRTSRAMASSGVSQISFLHSSDMPLTVEIWSDLVCPWCYIGKRRFEAALEASRTATR